MLRALSFSFPFILKKLLISILIGAVLSLKRHFSKLSTSFHFGQSNIYFRKQCPTHAIGFSGDSVVKNPAANTGDVSQSLGREDPLEEEMATHSNILAWRIPWTEESLGSQRVRHDGAHTQNRDEWLPGAGGRGSWNRAFLWGS